MARVSAIQRSIEAEIQLHRELVECCNSDIKELCEKVEKQRELRESTQKSIELLERVKANAEKNDTEDTEVQ